MKGARNNSRIAHRCCIIIVATIILFSGILAINCIDTSSNFSTIIMTESVVNQLALRNTTISGDILNKHFIRYKIDKYPDCISLAYNVSKSFESIELPIAYIDIGEYVEDEIYDLDYGSNEHFNSEEIVSIKTTSEQPQSIENVDGSSNQPSNKMLKTFEVHDDDVVEIVENDENNQSIIEFDYYDYNYAEAEEDWSENFFYYPGEILNSNLGKIAGPSGVETYYNLSMHGVINRMRDLGYQEEYWIRDDGVKMFGQYIMLSACFDIRPIGTILKTSLGLGIVCDTGGFTKRDPYQIDIAVNW